MEIQVRGSLNKESEVMGGLSFELYERYAYRTDKAAVFLSKQFLSRILDAYYCEPHDILAECDHVIYSDSDGKKVIMLRYDTDVYKVTVRKRDIPDIINYLRDNYDFFYDPNRKELEDDVKGLSLKVEELEDALKQACLHNSSDNADILTEYKRVKELNDRMRKNLDYFAKAAQERWENLTELREKIYKTYIAIRPNEALHKDAMDTLDDILTEYERVLKMKDDAETDNAKWRPYIADILGMNKGSNWSDICIRARVTRNDKDNLDLCLKMLEKHIKEAYSEVFQADADTHWFGHGCQAVTDIVEELKRERAIKEEADEKAVRYKEELRSVNESFEYQTLELCKILGLDAGSPPEDILEAVIRTVQCRDLLSRAHGDGQEERSKFLVNLAEVLGVKFSHFGCYPIMEREIQEALYLAFGDNKEEVL